MTLETKKFKNRFTDELVLAIRFTGKQDTIIEILDWVINNDGRAQGDILASGDLELKVHERGVGMIKVKPGEWIVKTGSGFEIYPVMTFTQMHEKVTPVMRVIKMPTILEAMQFTGDIENEKELAAWLKESNHIGSYRHTVQDTMVTYYRIELSNGQGSIDIRLNNWVIKSENELMSVTNNDFLEFYQRVN